MTVYPTYKDSGIEWLGQIPTHWEMLKAKYMFQKNKREVQDGDKVITCFRDGQVTLRENRRTTGFTESITEIGYQGIRKGDLVIHQMDAFAGAIGVSDADGKGTSVYHCCTPKGEYLTYYYAHVIREMALKGYILLSNLNHLQISLDGLAHTHDKRRYFKMGKPSFDLIISNIENFLRLTDIHLYIQVTVDKTNSNAYEDIVKFFNEKFPTYMNEKRIEIGFNAVQNRTDFERKSDCFNQEEVFLKNKIRLSQTKRKNLSSILPGIVPSCMYRNPTSFAIDPSGDMFKCLEHLGNSEYKVGNIKEKSVSLSKMAQATFGLDPFEDEECLACNVFPICGGGCPLDRQKKKMGKSINYCSIYKTRLADMLPALYECYEQ